MSKTLSANFSAKNALSALSARYAIRQECKTCAHRNECHKVSGIVFGGCCGADYAHDEKRTAAAVRLARRVDALAKEFNPWDYHDIVEEAGGHAQLIADNAALLLDGDASIEEWLDELIEDYEDDDDPCADLKSLLRSVRRFCAESRKF